MRAGKVFLIAGCLLLLLVALVLMNPEFRMVLNEVNYNLLTEAEAQGLMEAQLPMGAGSIVRDGCEIDGKIVGEMRFKLRDVKWEYHCGAADGLIDVSGVEGDFTAKAAEVLGCEAQVFSGGDVAKIIWFDATAGKAHSLVMLSDGDADVVQSIANVMQAAN